jgi:hypothetical protein
MPPHWSRGRTLSYGARGDTTDPHGTLQRLLEGEQSSFGCRSEPNNKCSNHRGSERKNPIGRKPYWLLSHRADPKQDPVRLRIV